MVAFLALHHGVHAAPAAAATAPAAAAAGLAHGVLEVGFLRALVWLPLHVPTHAVGPVVAETLAVKNAFRHFLLVRVPHLAVLDLAHVAVLAVGHLRLVQLVQVRAVLPPVLAQPEEPMPTHRDAVLGIVACEPTGPKRFAPVLRVLVVVLHRRQQLRQLRLKVKKRGRLRQLRHHFCHRGSTERVTGVISLEQQPYDLPR